MASFTTHATYSEFTLYSYWRSSSSWRVRAMLAAKKVKYDYVDRHLVKGGQFEEPYATSINKMQQVPALTFKSGDKMVTLTQSLAMIKFLEAAFPDINPITPADPIDLALAEEISEIINSGIQPLQNFSVMAYLTKESNETINGKAFGKTQIEKGLAAIEALVASRYADVPADESETDAFCLGKTSTPSVADMCLVPQLYNANRFNVDVDTICPTLVRVVACANKHPWFIASAPDQMPDAQV